MGPDPGPGLSDGLQSPHITNIESMTAEDNLTDKRWIDTIYQANK
jgi:hypothetical protein